MEGHLEVDLGAEALVEGLGMRAAVEGDLEEEVLEGEDSGMEVVVEEEASEVVEMEESDNDPISILHFHNLSRIKAPLFILHNFIKISFFQQNNQ